MTRLCRSRYTCCKCGAEDTYEVILATDQRGKPDLDFRPPESYRSTMEQWLQRCEACGYVNGCVARENGVPEDFVFSDVAYHELLRREDLPPVVHRFLLYAAEMEYLQNWYECMQAYLKAAWYYDDLGEEGKTESLRMRNKALDALEEIPPEDPRAERIRLLRLDLLRRVRLFSQAIVECKKLQTDRNEQTAKIATYQLKLCVRYDDKAHSQAEADALPEEASAASYDAEETEEEGPSVDVDSLLGDVAEE